SWHQLISISCWLCSSNPFPCHSCEAHPNNIKTRHFNPITCHSYEDCTCNSFICHSCKKHPGWVYPLHGPRLSPPLPFDPVPLLHLYSLLFFLRGTVYLTLTNRLREALVRYIQEHYSISIDVVLDRPPKTEMGEAASPVCFELAKRLKKAPRIIAQEIANGLGKVDGIARVEVAGGGYLNAYFDRTAFWLSAWKEQPQADQTKRSAQSRGKIIVEHTSINPNKAAHIGHVRNAVLGDTMAR